MPTRKSTRKQTLSTLTVLVPLREDAAPAQVAQRLAALGGGPGSPFAASERTHFARLVVLPADLPRLPRPQRMRPRYRVLDAVTHLGRRQKQDDLWRSYLVFSAAYDDGPAGAADAGEDYALHLHRRLGGRADDVWGACEGYPGVRDAAAFTRFVREHSLPARYTFTPPDGADVANVRHALQLRRQVVDLATATAGGTPAQLRERFAAAFRNAPDDALPGAATPPDPAANGVPVQRMLASPPDEDGEWNGWVRRDALAWPDRPQMRSDNRIDLHDVQGLTVGYPGHVAGAFVVLRVTHPARAGQWLGALEVTSAAHAHGRRDAAKRTEPDADLPAASSPPPAPTPDVALHVAVSHAGLAALGVAPDRLAGFDRSFRFGMAARESALAPGVGTSSWQAPFVPSPGSGDPADSGVHVLVHLSAADCDTLRRRLAEVVTDVQASGAFAEPWVQHAARIPDPGSNGNGGTPVEGERRRYVEHFGFVDGISQPFITGVSRSGGTTLPAGELLLGHDDVDGDTAGATAPPELARNGTYLVLRKLEQDVPAFRALAREAAARRTRQDDAAVDVAAVAAKLVGRGQRGQSLTGSDGGRMDFGDDPDGLRCPVGAHVRRVNPRDSRPLAVGDDHGEASKVVEEQLVRRHLMLRRGIPYGSFLGPDGATADDAAGSNGACSAGDDRGLLFIALVGDIGRQFEFVQTQWMNDGAALRLGTDRDVFSGAAGGGKFTIQGEPPVFVPTPRPVVTCRGGEYFLLPGRAALRRLAALSRG